MVVMDRVLQFAQALKAAHREVERRANDAMRPLGITGAQAEALVVIGAEQPLGLRELGERIVAESGHPSRLVDRLVDAGLVERRIPSQNRRRVELSLTARGAALLPGIAEAQRSVLVWGEEALTGHDLACATAALHAVLRDSPQRSILEYQRTEAARQYQARPAASLE
jgi:MarR family transcriptional regulator, organic hydroperoxide resistance regulator